LLQPKLCFFASHGCLSLTVVPRLTQSPDDVTVTEGHSVRLSCQASGQPEPQITWLHDRRSVSNNPHHTVEATGNLVINGVVVEDGGLYECQANNILGSATAQALLTVQGKERDQV